MKDVRPKTSHDAAEVERENLRNLFRQTPEMMCILSGPEHVFEFVNDAHIKALGFDATGMSVRKAQPESVEVHGILDEVYRTGVTADLREIAVTLTDRVRYFNLTYAARRDENNDVNGILILGSEVTDHVVARNVLERTARLIDAMPAPFFGTNENWEIIHWNPAAVEVIGLKKNEVLGKRLWDVFPHLEESEFGQTYKRAHAEQRTLSFEAYYPQYNKWYRVWPFPFEKGLGITFLDITETKRVEDEVRQSKERYQSLFDHSPLPKLTSDIETNQFLEVNLAATRLYGYSKDEFLAMKTSDIVSERVGDLLRYRQRTKDGRAIEVETTDLDLELNGRKIRIQAILDVSDRAAFENRQQELLVSLRAAKEEAERANMLKSAFLANMSHEIRTPLGAMVGFADLLRDPRLSREEHSNYINILTRNGNQLSEIINDILDLSKVEAGHLTLDFSETRAVEIAADVVSLLRVKAKEKDLVLEFTFEASTPDSVVTDSLRLRQTLMNVVANAIKFTHAGSIKIRSFGTDTVEGGIEKRRLYFEVADTGIGIAENQVEKVFEAFVQADGTLVRKFGGTGLGLALSRQLARELGGDVVITKTQEGKGSTFLISVDDQPLRKNFESKRRDDSPDAEPSENALDGVNVLVVDDSPDNRHLIWLFLNKYGASVDFAENGLLGYRKALSGNFHVVLMDIQMPEMDGYTATAKLREAGYRRPVLALTAHAMSEVRMKCLNVGCNDYLTKPIKPKELISAVAKYSAMN